MLRTYTISGLLTSRFHPALTFASPFLHPQPSVLRTSRLSPTLMLPSGELIDDALREDHQPHWHAD